MQIEYAKENFNQEEFLIEVGDLKNKISGFKFEPPKLTVYLGSVITPQEKVDLDAFVANHTGEFKEYIMPVSARQIRTALVMSGSSIATIEAALNSLPEPNKSIALIAWEYSNEYYRDNPLIESLAPAMGFTSEELDDLWRLARTL